MKDYLSAQRELALQREREATTLLTITHEHGVDITLHTSLPEAEKALLGYVKEWWLTDAGEGTPMPEDDSEAITDYFAKHAPGKYEITARAVALTITNEYGMDTFGHVSTQAAEAALLDYVKHWWAREAGEGVPMPEDSAETITAYFMEHAPGEDYVIAPLVAFKAEAEGEDLHGDDPMPECPGLQEAIDAQAEADAESLAQEALAEAES